MSSGKIKSSTVAATSAIQELVGIDSSKLRNNQVDFGYTSGISGMETARNTANTMLQAISDFSSAVLAQANKFPGLAQKIEKRDIEAAKRWEK
ncbi:MAG: TIGR04197 family type VII secretion effector [Streptococcaceae bacterium]|jgi:type VII secretion effector (TIGR04197 family)|nr:TIGR04197 family type VII secretion effector [Streptococcaceae bacterium]